MKQLQRYIIENEMNVGSLSAAGFLVLIMVLALVAPLICPIGEGMSPSRLNLAAANLAPDVHGYLLGTDNLGRDIFRQAIWGARASLLVGILCASISVLIGSLWGSFSAFAGGGIDTVMMRIVDGLLAIPGIILLLSLNSLFSTPVLVKVLPPHFAILLGVNNYSYGLVPLLMVVAVISATSWLEAARITRGKVLSLKREEYLTAAKSFGAGMNRIVWRHLLPNAASVIFVEAALLVSDAMLMESGLSFLGLGLGPATPSWGTMLNQSQLSLMQGNWWAVLTPGLLITLTVSAINLLVEGMFGKPQALGVRS